MSLAYPNELRAHVLHAMLQVASILDEFAQGLPVRCICTSRSFQLAVAIYATQPSSVI